MYSIFEKLCAENNVTPYKVGKATEIATSTLSDWKTGKSNPKQDKLQKIANYFNVSVEYLITGKEPKLSVSNAEIDTDLVFLDRKIKEYALKLAKLDKAKQDAIFALIDTYENKEG